MAVLRAQPSQFWATRQIAVWAAVVTLIVVLSACTGTGDGSTAGTGSSPSAGSTPLTSTSVPSTVPPSTDTAPTSEADNGTAATWDGEIVESAACDSLTATTVATVDGPTLTETSGVVASRQHPNVLWTHNDSGSEPAIVAIDLDGRELAAIALSGLPPDSGRDIEDIAIHDGRLYLADTGDNNGRRDAVAIHIVDEPDPQAAPPALDTETVTVRYPDRAWDVEAFAVDPGSGSYVFVAKRFVIGSLGDDGGVLSAAAAPVFVAEEPIEADVTVRYVGAVPVDQLDARRTAPDPTGTVGQLGLAGVPTGMDVSADGQHIALRTYGSVWLFERTAEQTMAESLTGTTLAVCEAPTVPEAQGEAVGFLDSPGLAFVTVAEGANPAINITDQG